MDQNLNYHLHNFGCKVNSYDAGLIQKNLKDHGYHSLTEKDATSGIHVLNTCAVTAEATQDAVRLIRRIKAKDPLATIVVTGCSAQVDTDAFSLLPSVNLVVANSHKGLLPMIIEQYFKGEPQKVFKSNIFRKEDLESGGGIEEKHSRAFLKIQDGCDSFCSYCIIPYARGRSRSISISNLVQRVRELENLGYQEVVLTGVHIGDYVDSSSGQNLRLEDLLEQLLRQTRMERYRLTSLEPVEISDRLLEIFKDSRICSHFHMSIQSGENQVLRDMKRQYLQQDIVESLLKIEKTIPNAFVGMDVIAGFPTENEESFEETYRVLSETPWTRLHVFPYSERPGTKAETFATTVPIGLRKARAAKLRNLSSHRMQAQALKQIGTRKELILLKNSKKNSSTKLTGLSKDFWNVQLVEMNEQLKDQTKIEVRIQSVAMSASTTSDSLLIGRWEVGVSL